jgi:hypothetical protein
MFLLDRYINICIPGISFLLISFLSACWALNVFRRAPFPSQVAAQCQLQGHPQRVEEKPRVEEQPRAVEKPRVEEKARVEEKLRVRAKESSR